MKNPKDKNDRNAHSKLFPPSSSKRWIKCPASAVVGAYGNRIETPPHPNTLRGTLRHNAAEDVLRGTLPDCAAAIGRTLDGQRVDAILAEEGQGYVDYVRKRLAEDPAAVLFVEVRLFFSLLIGADPGEAFGSGDVIIVQPTLRRVLVIDLKTGKHAVTAEGNTQLLFYGAGALNWFGMFWALDSVEITIYQRRASSWEVSRDYVNKFIASVRPAVARIKQLEALFLKTGNIPAGYYVEGACDWCPVLTCPHKAKEAARTSDLPTSGWLARKQA